MGNTVTEIYGDSTFLKAVDLQGKRHVVVIDGWDIQESFGSKQIVLNFVGKEKKFSLNKTNARMITDLLKTDDPDEWVGKSISIRPDKTQNPEGTLVDCIRVDFELPEQRQAVVQEKELEDFDDEAPAAVSAGIGGQGKQWEDKEIPF